VPFPLTSHRAATHPWRWRCWALVVFIAIIGHDALMAGGAHAIAAQGQQAHQASVSAHDAAQYHGPVPVVSEDGEDAAGECPVSQHASLWTNSGLNRDPARPADSMYTISNQLIEPGPLLLSREISPPEQMLLLFQILRI
jgi:hypothetical protein